MKKAVVMGAGGFIGSHMVKRLKLDGFWVRGVDLKNTEFSETHADDFVIGDLRDPKVVENVIEKDMDLLYQFAADMGGAGYIFTGDNVTSLLVNRSELSKLINKNLSNQTTHHCYHSLFQNQN